VQHELEKTTNRPGTDEADRVVGEGIALGEELLDRAQHLRVHGPAMLAVPVDDDDVRDLVDQGRAAAGRDRRHELVARRQRS
jgi:hypothetical protein